MRYLKSISFPDREREFDFFIKIKRTVYDSFYPFQTLINHIFLRIIFHYILNVRTLNDGIDSKREELFDEYLELKHSKFQLRSLDDYEQLRKVVLSRSKTQSRYVRNELMDNVRQFSNGENAFRYFTDKIEENGLYLLDEPENSLSPARQLELMKFIEGSARFFGCQFIISTHSPFFLAMSEAKIYDLDSDLVDVKKWTELENFQTYQQFFEEHGEEFEPELNRT